MQAVGERPPPARIDDWRAPRFAADIAEMRASLASMAEAIELTPERVVGDARDATGLDDLGTDDDPGWHDRLGILLRGLREKAGLGAWGTVSNHLQNAYVKLGISNRADLADALGL